MNMFLSAVEGKQPPLLVRNDHIINQISPSNSSHLFGLAWLTVRSSKAYFFGVKINKKLAEFRFP